VLYPALSIEGLDGELALAVVDDYSPTAAEQTGDSITIFFGDSRARDGARQEIAAAFPAAVVVAREVDDEDWARRSQANLEPVTVGRLRIVPDLRDSQPPAPSLLTIVIQPSMGFGTGHHATTRLCLVALQQEELAGRSVLDIGTGSGILAIAAARLGAAQAVGIDHDPDAIHAARESLSLNPGAGRVQFEVADLTEVRLKADTVIANLTGALLAREARRILEMVRPGGRLIVSGLLAAERDQVVAAFQPSEILWESREDEWVAIAFTANDSTRFPV
jgi:ribosomal protein L11 methyltransferase